MAVDRRTQKRNSRLARQFVVDVLNEGDVTVLPEVATSTVVEHAPGVPEGIAGFEQSLRRLRDSYATLSLSVEEVRPNDEKVVLTLTGTGVRRDEPGEVRLGGQQVFRIVDGRITDHWGCVVEREALRAFATGLRGRLVRPHHDDYDEVRSVWNGTVDRYPAFIVQCAGVADVVDAVTFARDHDLLLAVRGGGHNVAGNAVCDGGLVVDLSAMRSVQVDPETKRVRVEGGALLGDMDHEAQKFGLAVPGGVVSTTGVAGLTLGAGYGWLSRAFGHTCDNLLSADVVTADGRFITASAEEHPDLFWALRGGGGNFGVVTCFEFQAHELRPEVFAGPLFYSLADAPEVLDFYRDFVAHAPDELSCWFVLRHAPPFELIPEEHHGELVLVLVGCYAGDPEVGGKAFDPLRSFGSPIADAMGPLPYAAFQQTFDTLNEEGANNYWKSHYFSELTDDVVETLLEYAETLPSPEAELFVAQLGGAASRVPPDATAHAHRDPEFTLNIHGRWTSETSEDVVAWTRRLADALEPYATGDVYVNFLVEDDTEQVRAAYGDAYDRLVEVKSEYDPENLFSLNKNVKPTG